MTERSPLLKHKPNAPAALAEGREYLRLLRRSLVRIRALTADLVEPHGLTAPQFLALLWIRDSEGLTQVALSEELDSDQNTVSAMMRRLEAKGLVVRERHAGDGRAVVLRVTEHGRELVDRTLPEMDRLSLQLRAMVPAGDERAIASWLQAVGALRSLP